MFKKISTTPKIILFILTLFYAALPQFMDNLYYLHILNLAGIYTLITIGLNILTGYTGQVSMGQAGFFAVGTYVSALMMMTLNWPFWAAMVAAVLAAGFCGVLIGVPSMKLSGPYLVLATVGFGEIVRLILLNWVPVTRGAAGIVGIPLPEFFGFVIQTEVHFFYLILSMLWLGIYIALRTANSKIGRTYRAIREDELAAEAMGVNVNLYKISAFVVSAMYAGLAGGLFGSFAGVASPDNFTFDDSVGFLCMSVVGGSRSIFGALIGAFGLTILSEILRVFQGFRLIIYGSILLFTVIFLPHGLVGLFKKIFGKPSESADD